MSYHPSIFKRYISTAIDAGVSFLIFYLTLALENGELKKDYQLLGLLIAFLYEPVLTSKACTLGQLIMQYRVRLDKDLKNIGISLAVQRFILKLATGILSFLSVPLTKKKQALHDIAAQTIVVNNCMLALESN